MKTQRRKSNVSDHSSEEGKRRATNLGTSSTDAVRRILLRASSCRFQEPFRRKQSLLARVERNLEEREGEEERGQREEIKKQRKEGSRDEPLGHPVILMTIESFLMKRNRTKRE